MTGVEILFTPFFDGGATVTALVTAGATALGYKQYKRDEDELFGVDELPQWRHSLHDVRLSVDASHQALTAAWGRPLSLFREDDEVLAAHPCAAWVIERVKVAKLLVDEAAQLDDLEDVYEAQFLVAEREGQQGVLRQPVLALAGLLDALHIRITSHVPQLIRARDVLENGAAAKGQEVVQLPASMSPAAGVEATLPTVAEVDLPIVILRGRGSLGEVYKAVRSMGDSYSDSLGRTVRRKGGEAEAEYDNLPPEQKFSPYVLQYM